MLKVATLLGFCFALQAQVVSIDCGAPEDQYFVGGSAYADPSMGGGVLSTLRFGNRFSYRIPMPTGLYQVRFLFVEPNATAVGRRIFTVSVNGQTSEPIDLFKATGAKPNGYVVDTSALSSFGFINIEFAGATIGGVRVNAVISAIEISAYWAWQWPPSRTFTPPSQQVTASYECLRGMAFVGQQSLGIVSTIDGGVTRIQPTQLTTVSVQPTQVMTGAIATLTAADSQAQLGCSGIRAARFLRPDGTQTQPYLLVSLPAAPGLEVLDLTNPTYWRAAPIP